MFPTDVPQGWGHAPSEVLDGALHVTLTALAPGRFEKQLEAYYKTDGDYAGATFVDILPVDQARFTASDLFALTLLSIDAPKPRVVRQILDPGPTSNRLNELLGQDRLNVFNELQFADAAVLHDMAELYDAVKETLGSDPWVTASKLCARKRPGLFPVRDKLVRGLLGLTVHRNYQVDWQVFRMLIQHDDVRERLEAARETVAGTAGVHIDAFPLRWLDVGLWMHARADGRN